MPKSIEVEIGILLKNRKAVEDALKKQGAKLIYFARLKDYWFYPKSARSYKDTLIDRRGFALRIRESQDFYSNRKSSSLECKTLCGGKNHTFCNKYEIELSDINQTRKILESIGLKGYLLVDKERIIYKYKNAKFCFEKLKGLVMV